VLVASRVQLAGPVADLLACHHRLTGPRQDAASLPAGCEVIQEDHAGSESMLVVRGHAAAYPAQTRNGDSLVPVAAGEQISERQALGALLLPSAGNMAWILARWDAGRQAAFVARMNATARSLGMTATRYTDPSGLAASTVSTGADQVRLGLAAMRQPALAAIAAMPTAVIPVAGMVHNYNTLLGQDGIAGLKTGTNPGRRRLRPAHRLAPRARAPGPDRRRHFRPARDAADHAGARAERRPWPHARRGPRPQPAPGSHPAIRQGGTMIERTGTRAGRWRAVSARPAPLAAALAVTALLACACGGGGSPTATGTHQTRLQQALAYARCMRSHGAPNYPDPNSSGVFLVTPANNADFNAPAPARRACGHLLPKAAPLTPAQQKQQDRKNLAFAGCMRRHGFPKFPDSWGGGIHVDQMIKLGINVNSPQFAAALKACGF
jgi:hypothetical protein